MERSMEINDRVRARTSWPVPAGTLGRIYWTMVYSQDTCFVLFDGEVRVRLMHMSDLERVTEVGEDES